MTNMKQKMKYGNMKKNNNVSHLNSQISNQDFF